MNPATRFSKKILFIFERKRKDQRILKYVTSSIWSIKRVSQIIKIVQIIAIKKISLEVFDDFLTKLKR